MIERIGYIALPGVAADVGVELILPRPPFDRARLELGQVDVAQGEDGEGAKERAGRVRRPKDDGRLPRTLARWDAAVFRHQQEARVVLGVVFDVLGEDLRA